MYPDIRQKTPSSCGVAVIEAVCHHFSLPVPQNVNEWSDEEGFIGGVEGMRTRLLSLGLGVTPVSSLPQVFPAIALILDSDSQEHWITLTGATPYSVETMCPTVGREVLSHSEFDASWSHPDLPVKRLAFVVSRPSLPVLP